jgi:aldose 1-epimerase
MLEQQAFVLRDAAEDLHATWLAGAGMLCASLVHRGEELLWSGRGPEGYARDRTFMGIPFLHPWANRLDGFRYVAGGRAVVLDPGSPLLLRDERGLPIHGLLTAHPGWVVREARGDRLVATFAFDRPELLATFPFPHQLEIEVTLRAGAMTVGTTLTAGAGGPVPVAFGFHPYLRIPGVPRAAWEVELPVRRRLVLDDHQIPTGETEDCDPIAGPVGARTWDDGFDRLDRTARFRVRGGRRTIDVELDGGYPVAQVFAPPGAEYLCLEPMTAPANALARPGDALTWVPAGGRHRATFRIACAIDA